MYTEKRDRDIVTGIQTLKPEMVFKNFPVYMGCVNTPIEDDIHQDMCISISEASGMLQLNPIVKPQYVYMESHGSGTVGQTWRDHHTAFAYYVLSHASKLGKVMEIGAGHGILHKLLRHTFSDYTVVEPNFSGPKDEAVTYIDEYFTSKIDTGQKYDTIIHSHVFEHVTDVHDFITAIDKHLSPDGRVIFSVPNMDYLIDKTFVLSFEHTFFLGEEYVRLLMNMHDFETEQLYHGNHSIFFSARRKVMTCKPLKPENVDKYGFMAWDVLDRSLDDVRKLNLEIKKHNGPVYLFGGHIFSQFLLNIGLESYKLSCIVDNDPNKAGKRLYGSPLYVRSPKEIAPYDNPAVIVRAGVYTSEIVKQLKLINKDCVIL